MKSLKHLNCPVLYIRGLNTYGDDQLRFGLLGFGPMWRPWISALKALGVVAIPVEGMGGTTLEDQVRHAVAFIQRLPLWSETQQPIHLLGHSTGGLIARALVHELKDTSRIASVVTMATPHHGSPLALLPINLKEHRPYLDRALRTVGYQSETKIRPLDDLTPQAAEIFNQRYTDVAGVQYGAAIFSLPPYEMSWPMYLAIKVLDHRHTMGNSDGFVPENSQIWGKTICRAHLDHLDQIGFVFSPNPWRRKRVHQELHRVQQELMQFWQTTEKRYQPGNYQLPLN